MYVITIKKKQMHKDRKMRMHKRLLKKKRRKKQRKRQHAKLQRKKRLAKLLKKKRHVRMLKRRLHVKLQKQKQHVKDKVEVGMEQIVLCQHQNQLQLKHLHRIIQIKIQHLQLKRNQHLKVKQKVALCAIFFLQKYTI